MNLDMSSVFNYKVCYLLPLALGLLAVSSCSSHRRLLRDVAANSLRADISLPEKNNREFKDLDVEALRQDTLVISQNDGTSFVMNAVKDDDSGEMVATDVISAATITARFRNVAERNGMVDLVFEAAVPPSMIKSQWQLRLYPKLFMMGDSLHLEPIIITGTDYRKRQLRGYERYNNYLRSIIGDRMDMVNEDQLTSFIARNMPSLYKMKRDSSFVSEDEFRSLYGVGEEEAIIHYTDRFIKRLNDKRISRKGYKYRKYVKAPFDREGIRLDTLVNSADGTFVLEYVETIKVRRKLRKAEIVLCGEILQDGQRIYSMPDSDTLSFYISSLASFINPQEKYLTRIVERKAKAQASFRLMFDAGRSEWDPENEDNMLAVANIKRLLSQLLENKEYDLDSVVVAATASPEGSYALNARLSEDRGLYVKKYFDAYMKSYCDSLKKEEGFYVNVDSAYSSEKEESRKVHSIIRVMPENWEQFFHLVERDTVLSEKIKNDIKTLSSMPDPDQRESHLKSMYDYEYIKEVIYPKLRCVHFDFALSRKGMVKDTVHTTVLDTIYMAGLKAVEDRDYESAIRLLGPYRDYNAAVAFAAMGYNHSALEILESIPSSDKVNYMLALIWSRLGNPSKAVSYFLQSCRENEAMRYRANLDPEIYLLIKEYGLSTD